MLIPFGVLSAAGVSGVVPSDYELIETTILGTATSSITFSSLATYASTYKHLQIRAVARTTRAFNGDGLNLTLNSDSGANYSNHRLTGNGSTVSSTASTSTNSITVLRTTAATSVANAFGVMVIDFLDSFSTTKNKTVRYIGGALDQNEINLGSGARFNTASITDITLTGGNGDLVAGSRFSLYGIKG